jgi:hypothetical protein
LGVVTRPGSRRQASTPSQLVANRAHKPISTGRRRGEGCPIGSRSRSRGPEAYRFNADGGLRTSRRTKKYAKGARGLDASDCISGAQSEEQRSTPRGADGGSPLLGVQRLERSARRAFPLGGGAGGSRTWSGTSWRCLPLPSRMTTQTPTRRAAVRMITTRGDDGPPGGSARGSQGAPF